MVDCVKIANDAYRARYRADNEGGNTPFFDFERVAFAKNNEGYADGDKVAEKAFLKDGQIPRKADEKPHKREEKCGKQDKKHSLFGAFYPIRAIFRARLRSGIFHFL